MSEQDEWAAAQREAAAMVARAQAPASARKKASARDAETRTVLEAVAIFVNEKTGGLRDELTAALKAARAGVAQESDAAIAPALAAASARRGYLERERASLMTSAHGWLNQIVAQAHATGGEA